MLEWQWHQFYHMQIICTSLQTDNHASISSLKFFCETQCMITLPKAFITVTMPGCDSMICMVWRLRVQFCCLMQGYLHRLH